MNWTYLLTSTRGRISRQPFWIALLALIAVETVAYVVMGERWSNIVSLLLTYPEFAVLAKRGHDRNVPTWVVGIFMAVAVALSLIVLADLQGPPDSPNAGFLVIAIPASLMALVLMIDFGFRRGTVGPNRFGSDPFAVRP